MANWNDPQPTRTGFGASPSLNGASVDQVGIDQGLRSYMLSIYNYMASGVLLTGIVSLLVSRSDSTMQVLLGGGALTWLVMLSPLAIVMVMSFGANRLSTSALRAMFWVYAILMGVSLSSIFLVYTGGSIATMFFATAAAFAGLSLYGYTTQRDLSGMGSFMVMGLFGIIIASVINMFIGSSSLDFAISILGVLIFAGLTAWDTQKLKAMYYQVGGTEFAGKTIVLGALTLYLDFINMFLFLLRLFGDRR